MRVQYTMSQKQHTLDIKKRGHCSAALIEAATLSPSSHGLLLNTSDELLITCWRMKCIKAHRYRLHVFCTEALQEQCCLSLV